MERLDKVISSQMVYSRKDVKDLVRKKEVTVNGVIVSDASVKVDVNKDNIMVMGNCLRYQEFVYLILNKPKGFVSATEDRNMKTVLDLVPIEYMHRELFPAGRLDKDTTGLMLITDDGGFAHNILSPSKHVKKTYLVTIDIPLSNEMVDGFKKGVKLSDGECKEASLEIIDEHNGIVTLVEGRYHQIKRMFGCYGAKVLELKRIGMGNLTLPDDLLEGECRELSSLELGMIQER